MASIITLMSARITLALIAAFSLGQAGPPLADIILHNGRFVTVDQGFSIAEAVAIANGRFTAVGGNDTIRRLASRSTRMIDLAGRTVVPGFIDNHLHSAGGGPGVDLSRARSIDDVLRAVFARIEQTEPGGIVVSNSDWHEAQLEEQRLPLRDDLDPISKTHPVVLVRGGHEYIVNSAAFARWKINESTTQPAGGKISRYPDGRLNGELVDAAKSLIALPPAPARNATQRMGDRLADYTKLHAVGLTTVRHPGVSIEDYRALQEMQRRGVLSMRVHALLRPMGDTGAVLRALDESGIRVDEGDEWLRVGGIKLAVDGGFEGGLMRDLYQPPFDEGGTFRGLQTVDPEQFDKTVRALNLRGWRVATHAVGDAAMDRVLDAYEAANRDRSIVDRRWAIEHAFIGRPDHLPRLKKLDVAISAQNHLYLAGPSLVKYWGPQRAALTTPLRTYLDAGLMVSSGTDAPVVPYPPLWTIYHFVTRDTMTGGVMGADQKVSRQEALRLSTINNAWLLFEESIKGSIETGKVADLVVLADDILTAPEARIRDGEVIMTMVGGRMVYVRAGWPPAGELR
jgi:predicted amidohydrolase YtcJ